MEKQNTPARFVGKAQSENANSAILRTGLLLIAGFILLIILFTGFTSLIPNFMGQCVAVVTIDTPISIEGQPASLLDPGYPGSEEISATLRSLESREDVGAVVIVFNSPGGSVVATREIYNGLQMVQKPKVSYFRETAASGAYYIASGTDYIVSDPDAITGSIGVVATFYEMSGLFEKIGINMTSVTSGPHKDIGSPARPMTEEEFNITKALVEEVFAEFKDIVVQNRGKKLDATLFAQALDGRILTGRQAKSVGLVDSLGTKRDAIIKAADLANITYDKPEDIRVCQIQTREQSGGLLGISSLFNGFKLGQDQNSISLSYK